MLIVDSQVHIWAADSLDRPWFPGQFGTALRDEPVSAEEIVSVTEKAGVRRAVLVPMGWDGDRNDLALAAAAKWPDRFAIMGRIKLEDSSSRGALSRWRDQPGMKGIRLSPGAEKDAAAWLTSGRADWLWAECERLNLPIMIYAPTQLPLVGLIAERYPGLRLIVDHMGLVDPRRSDGPFQHFPELLKLARLGNVAVKASALPCYIKEPYPFPTLQKYIRDAYDAFGPTRLFWGSDYGRLTCSYEQNLNLFLKEMAWLSEEDKEWIMGRGLCEWLDWRY